MNARSNETKESNSFEKDGINSKLLKYATEETHVQIANMLNNIACTGEYTKKKQSLVY